MKRIFFRSTLLWICLAIVATFTANAATKSPLVLMVSVDGLRPDYITRADEHGLKIPNLRKFLTEGTYAEGARGVLPSSTYPSHTTLVTGVYPVKHGIDENHPFDPSYSNPNAWHWFAEDIHVPTLWQAAANAKRTVGSISWPVTVGAEGIRYNLPEFNGTRSPEDLKMVRALASRKLMEELAKSAGPYEMDLSEALARDQSRTRYAIAMLQRKDVDFLTLHLAVTDHLQHRIGPFAEPVLNAVEEIDKMMGTLITVVRKKDPHGIICLVSDHGFARVTKVLNLYQAFVDADLITLKSKGESIEDAKIKSWIALPSSSGGAAYVVMKNPKDQEAITKVKTVLEKLAANPTNGIERILDRKDIAKLGGTTEAEFWVDMKIGHAITATLSEPLVSDVKTRGAHGYVPTHSEMNSCFFIMGDTVRKGLDLGVIDMRSIAPTVAKAMHIPFPSADLPPLEVFTKE